MAAKLSAPVDVQIELTRACNWRCRHCYNYWRPYGITAKPNQYLSRDRLLHIVGELAANQIPSITITGGEPFSRPENVFALLKMTQEAGIHASINTNLSQFERRTLIDLPTNTTMCHFSSRFCRRMQQNTNVWRVSQLAPTRG